MPRLMLNWDIVLKSHRGKSFKKTKKNPGARRRAHSQARQRARTFLAQPTDAPVPTLLDPPTTAARELLRTGSAHHLSRAAHTPWI